MDKLFSDCRNGKKPGSLRTKTFKEIANSELASYQGSDSLRVKPLSTVTVTGSAVPEPSTFALLGFGVAGLTLGAYRRRKAASGV